MEIRPFKVEVPQATLDDLQDRLARTRWPHEVESAGWDYGADLSYMKALVAYWRDGFDWRQQERTINEFSHYKATVDGYDIHFIHERGKGPDPMPLIITHGWPSSFFEMHKIIPLLTDPARHGGDPADSFDVVVPSLIGYGFSSLQTRRGMIHHSHLWASLMQGLGYTRFGAQGGDVGAGVTSALGRHHPGQVLGIHLNGDLDWPDPMPDESDLSEEEKDFLSRMAVWEREEGGYMHAQGTKPLTLAYGLNDSPVGLAAYIVEKFHGWSDCGGDVESRFTKDELLTNVTLYWATETIYSGMLGYYERQHYVDPDPPAPGSRVEVPTGVAMYPKDFYFPREWAERSYNVQRWTEVPTGGHFAAQEEPQLLVEDIRAFFRPLRQLK
jgi:pimeloyl-ACP methyl ester carboxylesterase